VILNVGRQEYQKGQRYLIEAFSELTAAWPDAWLVIAGRNGNVSTDLTQRSSGLDRILRLGHRSDVPELLHAADVFAFPSLYEGLGGALLEAMAVGLAIVASDVPAIREVAGESILYAPPGNTVRLKEQIERLLGDRDLRTRLGVAARQRFDEGPTIEQVADRMVEWYRRYAS
jgi:glycosyltransferase involved in cell wall biosynthesis